MAAIFLPNNSYFQDFDSSLSLRNPIPATYPIPAVNAELIDSHNNKDVIVNTAVSNQIVWNSSVPATTGVGPNIVTTTNANGRTYFHIPATGGVTSTPIVRDTGRDEAQERIDDLLRQARWLEHQRQPVRVTDTAPITPEWNLWSMTPPIPPPKTSEPIEIPQGRKLEDI